MPSLDTPVCDLEAKRFNEEASKLPTSKSCVVSMDLPFAQKRWCGAANADKVVTASDHREASFGKNYGLLISGGPLDRVLARAVFVIGAGQQTQTRRICAAASASTRITTPL